MPKAIADLLVFRLVRTGLAALLLASAAAPAQQAGGEDVIAAEEEPLSRYAIEVILFTYGSSVSAGTEVFMPEEPSTEEIDDFAGPNSGETPGNGLYDGVIGPDVPLAPNPSDDDVSDETDTGPNFGSIAKPVQRAVGFDDPSMPGRGDPGRGEEDESIPSYSDRSMGDGEFPEIDLDQPLELIVTDAASVEYTPMPDEKLTLASAHEELLRLEAYDPVLWAGWTQVVREQARSPALNLRRLGNLPLSIDGTLTLYLGRFVHLVADVSLVESIVVQPVEDPGLVFGDRGTSDYGRYRRRYNEAIERKIVYRINEDRIMRNGETRYFDHPKLGLIARLTLVEEPAEAEPDPRFLPDILPGNVDLPR